MYANPDISAQQNRRRIFRRNIIAPAKIDAGQNRAGQNRRRSESAQKKNELTWLYSALIKKKFVCEVNSFAFNGNSLHWELDCIFALLLRSSVNHYYKQVIRLNHNKILYYCNCHATISSSVHMFATFFGSCENKISHYKRSRDLRCITPGIVQCRLCENATLLAIKQFRKITFC